MTVFFASTAGKSWLTVICSNADALWWFHQARRLGGLAHFPWIARPAWIPGRPCPNPNFQRAQMPSGVRFSFFASVMFGSPEFPSTDLRLQDIVNRVASGVLLEMLNFRRR